jgi:hypothetical protein
LTTDDSLTVDLSGRLIVGYGMTQIMPQFQGDQSKIIETYMTSDGKYFYREHYGGFFSGTPWIQGVTAL